MLKDREVFGSFEKVNIPRLGLDNVVAKIDTGAYSGALHCSKIREYVRKSDGKHILSFIPSCNYSNEQKLTKYIKSYVRSSNGHRMRRYLFDTNIVIKGREYPIRIGLSDRSDMNYEILIGRRFLRNNNILVDIKVNQEYDIDSARKDRL